MASWTRRQATAVQSSLATREAPGGHLGRPGIQMYCTVLRSTSEQVCTWGIVTPESELVLPQLSISFFELGLEHEFLGRSRAGPVLHQREGGAKACGGALKAEGEQVERPVEGRRKKEKRNKRSKDRRREAVEAAETEQEELVEEVEEEFEYWSDQSSSEDAAEVDEFGPPVTSSDGFDDVLKYVQPVEVVTPGSLWRVTHPLRWWVHIQEDTRQVEYLDNEDLDYGYDDYWDLCMEGVQGDNFGVGPRSCRLVGVSVPSWNTTYACTIIDGDGYSTTATFTLERNRDRHILLSSQGLPLNVELSEEEVVVRVRHQYDDGHYWPSFVLLNVSTGETRTVEPPEVQRPGWNHRIFATPPGFYIAAFFGVTACITGFYLARIFSHWAEVDQESIKRTDLLWPSGFTRDARNYLLARRASKGTGSLLDLLDDDVDRVVIAFLFESHLTGTPVVRDIYRHRQPRRQFFPEGSGQLYSDPPYTRYWSSQY